MATLTRLQYKSSSGTATSETARGLGLAIGVPSPFPVTALRDETQENLSAATVDLADDIVEETPTRPAGEETPKQTTLEVGPLERPQSAAEIAAVSAIYDMQSSTISALQHILLSDNKTRVRTTPIIRRHSMPPLSTDAAGSASEAYNPLRSLLAQLISLTDDSTMQEIPQTSEGIARELRARIRTMSSSLSLRDYQLANALCSVASDLAHIGELTTLTKEEDDASRFARAWESPADIYESLHRKVMCLESYRQEAQSLPLVDESPIYVVQRQLIWNRIDRVLDDVRELCRNPADPFASHEDRFSFEAESYLPPDYDLDGADSNLPPSYEPSDYIYTSFTEKPRKELDLDDIAEAIDHFNRVNPQLIKQRFDMDAKRTEQMEMARLIGAVDKLVSSGRLDDQRAVRSGSLKGKDRMKAVEDDGVLWDLIERASTRRLADQRVEISGGMEGRLAKANMKERQKRDAFMTTLAQHSSAGRMTSQDAIMRPSLRDPDALLSFPEFIRESAQPSRTVPFSKVEFSATEPELAPAKEPTSVWSRKKGRDRSISAPPLAWLKNGAKDNRPASPSPSVDTGKENPNAQSQISVRYVAEHLGQLKRVRLDISTDGLNGKIPSVLLGKQSCTPRPDGEHPIVLLTIPGETTITVPIPAPVQPHKPDVQAHEKVISVTMQSDAPAPSTSAARPASSYPVGAAYTDIQRRLLDASTLDTLNPSSFTCASCSLHLVRGSAIARYDDLPSEYWNDMIDMWMCHADHPLPEAVKNGKSLTPAPAQALVGGSYILFNEADLVERNIRRADVPPKDASWTVVRCLCGQIVGRARADGESSTTYRFNKYGLRLMGTTSEPPRVPVSAYVVQDMLEVVEAHATYHFIIEDEQDSRPRGLIWLFNPAVELTWSVRKSVLLPKEGSCLGAIVFYKAIGPFEDPSKVLKSYTDFQRAEHLSYPIDVCRRLAHLLKDSHGAYPEAITAKGLNKAWLAKQ